MFHPSLAIIACLRVGKPNASYRGSTLSRTRVGNPTRFPLAAPKPERAKVGNFPSAENVSVNKGEAVRKPRHFSATSDVQ